MKRYIARQLITVMLTTVSIMAGNNALAASILSGSLNVDNTHTTYISTDNSIAGNQIATGNDWTITDTFSDISLVQGQDYFLHTHAFDLDDSAGFLGDFSLAGSDHVFVNGATGITTNDIDWLVSTSGWGSYVTATSFGQNGVSPWGTIVGVDNNATWIWSADNENDNETYFSLAIVSTTPSAVPVPAAVWLFGSGLIGLIGMRKNKSKASVVPV